MKPLKYSNPFYFGNEPSIEFCIGFTINELKKEKKCWKYLIQKIQRE